MAREAGSDEDKTLEALLESSLTEDGRARLAAAATVATVLENLSSSYPHLLLCLRLLRNLLVGNTSNQYAFLSLSGTDAVASILLSVSAPEVLRAGLQVLGNAAIGNEPQRVAVWKCMFPVVFLSVAQVRNPVVCDPLCMVLDTCCGGSSTGGRERMTALSETSQGIAILVEIIATASHVGYKEEWFEWLLFKVCVEEQKFSALLPELNLPMDDSDNGANNSSVFTAQNAFLLGALSKCLAERPREVMISDSFALYVLNLLKSVCKNVNFTLVGQAELPNCSPEVNVLGYSLLLLRDICAWEDMTSSNSADPVDLLLQQGLLDLLLSLLCDLGFPTVVRKSMGITDEQATSPMVLLPKLCPYNGFRRDIVSVIANCLYRRKQAQDEVRLKNCILLLLQQCVVDEANPFLREWGLFAVRNLLEENLENQREVAELKPQGPVQGPELSQLNVRVEVDPASGRPKLVNA